MPVFKCSNGKWRIGEGPCVYSSKGSATKAYIAYLAKKENERIKKNGENKSDNEKDQR